MIQKDSYRASTEPCQAIALAREEHSHRTLGFQQEDWSRTCPARSTQLEAIQGGVARLSAAKAHTSCTAINSHLPH